jgi:dTDP-4-amino-4,6-dideoxygalactose transaminase
MPVSSRSTSTGRPMASDLIRLSRSVVGVEEQQALAQVIEEGYLGMGRFTQQFEVELREYLRSDREVICVNTGTAALQLALQGLGVGPGDEVIVPSLTFVASFQAIAATGARPVACDSDPETAFIDVADAARRLTSKTRVVMPVHYASAAPELEAVYAFAKEHRLRVVEDAAHAFACTRNGALVGSTGDVVCFSFDGIKNITSGEGGAIVTADARVAERVRDARLLGVEKDTEKRYSGQRSWEFDVHEQGWRYHMSNLMAAIGSAQLRKLPRFAQHRRTIAQGYRAGLRDIGGLAFLQLPYDEMVPHIFVVRVLDGRRDELMAYLRARGIECGFHYKPNHLLSRFRTEYPLPGAERLGQELASLPIHASLSAEEQHRVIQAVREFFSGGERA